VSRDEVGIGVLLIRAGERSEGADCGGRHGLLRLGGRAGVGRCLERRMGWRMADGEERGGVFDFSCGVVGGEVEGLL
jgi:hypothetical protein